MNLDEVFRIKGDWWLPDITTKKLPGELMYDPSNGINLEIQGVFQPRNNEGGNNDSFQNESIILGNTSKGDAVSLLYCTQTKGRPLFSGHEGTPITAYRVMFAFFGIRFPSAEEVDINMMAVNYSHLDDWLDTNTFKVERQGSEEKHPGFENTIIRYKKPDDQQVNFEDFTITFKVDGPTLDRSSASEFIVSQKSWVVVRTDSDKKNYKEFMGIFRRIQDFLTLGVGKPVYPIEVKVLSDYNTLALDNGKVYLPPIQMLYDRPWQPKKIRRIYPSEMTFTLKIIQNNLASYLSKWFEKAKQIKPVLDIYFSTKYREQIFTEHKLLSMTQAIETYHRRLKGGKYLSDEKFMDEVYPKLVSAIPAELDRGFKDSLRRGKLRYANEYSLRKRLRELADHLSRFLPQQFLLNSDRRNFFIERVCDTRNYLTHYDTELQEKAAITGEEQYGLVVKLSIMLDALLLEELGFQPEEVSSMIMKQYQNMIDGD